MDGKKWTGMENCFLSLVLFVIQRTRLYILDHSASHTCDDCHECRARDSRVIGVAESPFFLVVLRVTYYVHEIAKPNMHELKHSTVQFRVQWCNNSCQ